MSGKRTLPEKKREKEQREEVLSGGMENISDEDRMERAIKLFNGGNYIEAIENFSVLSDRGVLLARQYLARCYYRLENYEVAAKHFLYLSENADGKMKDYSISMLATIEELYGNIDKAINILRTLPKTTPNIINLSVMLWKKGVCERDERSIRDAMSTLQTIDVDKVEIGPRRRIYHIKALLYQAQREFRLAESFFGRALSLADDNASRARILNDFASLHIEQELYEEAKKTLEDVKILVKGENYLEEAFNNKWFGLLYSKLGKFEEAKEYLKMAVKVLKDKHLLREIAGITFSLADILKDTPRSFYQAANYYAEGIKYELLIEEVKQRDEKIIDFIFDSFFECSDYNSNDSRARI